MGRYLCNAGKEPQQGNPADALQSPLILVVMHKEEQIMRPILFLAFISVVLLSGCATTYQKESFTGGFSETQLGENIFQVSFKGNAYTSREKASDFTLLRSAEIAIENGYRYFVVIESEKYSKAGTYTSPTTSQTTGSAYASGNYVHGSATTTTYGGQTYTTSKPRANNTILCYKEKPDINGLIFEAEFVVRSIRAKYGMN
jgi:hypothetical protein